MLQKNKKVLIKSLFHKLKNTYTIEQKLLKLKVKFKYLLFLIDL